MYTRREFLRFSGAGALAFLPPIPFQEDDPYLLGNFAPVLEERTEGELKVTGSIPADLRGLYVRNGPNPPYPPKPYHWFDGDGMLHGIYLADGRARYVNRFVRTAGFEKEREAKKSLYGGFAKGPPFKNAANTSLLWHHRKLLALWEGGPAHAIEPSTLATIGPDTWEKKYDGPFTAHPKVDPESGELIFFGIVPMPVTTLHYRVADAAGQIVYGARIKLSRWVMMHDIAITAKYTLFLDLPLLMSFQGLKYQPDAAARIGILPRRGAAEDLRWFDVAGCFVYHTLNAWDEGDTVVLLGCRYAKGPGQAARLFRWTFDLKSGKVEEKELDDATTEFPRINERFTGRRTRYGYAGRFASDFSEAVVKYDHEKGTSEAHVYGKDRFGGECVFVPRPGGKDEDDGWLATFVYDKAADRSEFVLIDAKRPSEPPVARVHLPCRVPYGLHGSWAPGVEAK